MSSSGPPMIPPGVEDVDRGPQLMAMYWTWSALSLILLSLRLYARFKIRSIGWDDWFMLITVVLFVITACIVTYMASIGGARHAFFLTPAQTLAAVKWSWISQPWAIFLFATGKASVAILTLRFIGRNTVWRKYALWFVIATIFIVNSLGCIITFVQCDPPSALWTPGTPASCWDPRVQERFNYFLAAWNIAADIVLALLPATFISKLNLRRRKKIALCILLGLGLVAAAFSAVKVRFIADLSSRADFTWAAYDIQVWTGAEAFVMILCGNIPPLQPLWDRFVTHKLDSSYGRTALKYSNGSSGGGGGAGYSGTHNSSRARGQAKMAQFEPLRTQDDELEMGRGKAEGDGEGEGLGYGKGHGQGQIYATTDIHVSPSARAFV